LEEWVGMFFVFSFSRNYYY